MKRAFSCGVVSALALTLSAAAQERVIPQNQTWQTPIWEEYDGKFVPMVIVWWYAEHAEWQGYRCMPTGALAAEHVAYVLRDATWINTDGSNVMITLPQIGHNYPAFVPGEPCEWPVPFEEDDRAFWRVADSLSGYPGNPLKANRHPFLTNATTNSPMKAWIAEFRDSLPYWLGQVQLNLDPNKFQFAFDNESIVTDESGESVQTLWFLRHDREDIWYGWKVPGSPGWQPHADHASNPNGQTLARMYQDMVDATEGTNDEWPEDILQQLDRRSL